jgi:hypothetical protein
MGLNWPAARRCDVCARFALFGFVLVNLMSLTSSTAFAWGATGHSHITGGAIPHLPLPLRSFFEANAGSIRNLASQEPPGKHYIDIDVYPEFAAGTFPHDVNALIATYGYSYVESNGMGPWTYAGYVEQLSSLMAAAKTKEDWAALVPTAAAEAHYIEDLHNPLHLTRNYDGQYSGNNGVHSRYESQMISRNLSSLTFADADAVYEPTLIDDVFDGIDVHYQFVDDIMAADTAAHTLAGSTSSNTYYNSLWSQTGDFTRTLFQQASEAVANGWYTAWVNAGSPIPNLGLAGDYNGDNKIDAADYTVWRDAMASSSALMNDSTPNSVSIDDFNYWKSHFGQSIGGGFGSIGVVPEPAAALMAMFAGVAHCLAVRRRAL